ncbi:MAG: hypothetical protein LBQ79_07700 [Deltaproteobacteria bacterium]|nr:hypothetical protein [Deltaproteobacteria bacterium]
MLIECAFCQKKLNIPASAKLPVGRPFTFSCPSCGNKNTVTLPSPDAAPSGPPPAAKPPEPVPSPGFPPGFPPGGPDMTMHDSGPGPGTGPAQGQDMGQVGMGPVPGMGPMGMAPGPDKGPAGMGPMGMAGHGPGPGPGPGGGHGTGGFSVSEAQSIMELSDSHEGLKSALVVYDEEQVQNHLQEKLTNMGFKVSVALNIRDAAKQLKFASFQVVLIQENYYGATLKNNQLLKAIQGMEVHTRHKMFVGMIGPSFTSLDDLLAFSLSLDTVINTRDMDDVERLLISAIEHVNKFFSAYNELRASRGVD